MEPSWCSPKLSLELAFSFAQVLHVTFVVLDHVNEIGR